MSVPHTLSVTKINAPPLKWKTLFCLPWVGFLDISLARLLSRALSFLKKISAFCSLLLPPRFSKNIISNSSLLLYSSMLNKDNAKDAFKSSWGPFWNFALGMQNKRKQHKL